MDAGGFFCVGDTGVADGNRADDAHVLFLVLCRSVAPYPGRRNMRPNTIFISDKKDYGTATSVQGRICWRVPVCDSVLRDYVFGCSKIARLILHDFGKNFKVR